MDKACIFPLPEEREKTDYDVTCIHGRTMHANDARIHLGLEPMTATELARWAWLREMYRESHV